MTRRGVDKRKIKSFGEIVTPLPVFHLIATISIIPATRIDAIRLTVLDRPPRSTFSRNRNYILAKRSQLFANRLEIINFSSGNSNLDPAPILVHLRGEIVRLIKGGKKFARVVTKLGSSDQAVSEHTNHSTVNILHTYATLANGWS